MRLMYSKRDFVEIYDRCDQVSFLDGHVRGFEDFVGFQTGGLRQSGVSGEASGRTWERELTDAFLAMTSHYVFELALPGVARGMTKEGWKAEGSGIVFST